MSRNTEVVSTAVIAGGIAVLVALALVAIFPPYSADNINERDALAAEEEEMSPATVASEEATDAATDAARAGNPNAASAAQDEALDAAEEAGTVGAVE